jgi:hypothetical protein
VKPRPCTHVRYGRYWFFYAPKWNPFARRRAKRAADAYDRAALAEGAMDLDFQPPPFR